MPTGGAAEWGDRYASDKPPRIARRRSDQSPITVRLLAADGSLVEPGDVELVPGPGLPDADSGKKRAGSRR